MKNFTHYTPNTVFEYGQYKGMTLEQIAKENASYILWCTIHIEEFLISRQLLEFYSDKYGTISFFEDPDGTREFACCNNAYLLTNQAYVLLEEKWQRYRE